MNSMRPSNSVIKRQRARRKKNKKAIMYVRVLNADGWELDPKKFRSMCATVLQSTGNKALMLSGIVSIQVRWKHGEDVHTHVSTHFVGTSWDGASIPKFLQQTFGDPFQKSQWRPSFVHDMLYGALVDREIADEAYLYLMQQEEELDIGWLKEHLIYAGVRLGGWTRYEENSKNIIKRTVARALIKWV